MPPGRNEPCSCGSGKRYKHCCGAADLILAAEPSAAHPDTLAQLLKRGRPREAELGAEAALKSAPESGALWKLLGLAQLRQGRDALPALRRAVALLPDDAEAHAALGALLRERGDWQGALASLSRSIDLERANPQTLIDAAEVLRALGRPREAVNLYLWALKLDPKRREAHNDVGNAYLELGQPAEAARWYRNALEMKLDDPLVICNLANALRQLGEFTDAAALSERAIALSPGLAMAHNNLGLCRAGVGRTQEALASYREAVRLSPTYVEALTNLGNVLSEQGKRREALDAYARAADADPRRADAHANLGYALLELRRVRPAEASFRSALARDPQHVAAHVGLASALRLQRQTAAAEASCQAALALAPEHGEALLLLGELRADRGQFEAAHECFERVRTLEPTNATAYACIAAHRRMTAADAAWRTGAEGLLDRALPLGQQVRLRYALGKYFDDTGAYASAFGHYREANELTKRYGATYSEAKLAARVERIMHLASPEWLRTMAASGSDSKRPVLVIGMPRSGTSLAEQILASHPDVYGSGEIRFWDQAFENLQAVADDPLTLAAALPQAAAAYLERATATAGEAPRVVDKMPANFLYAGVIHAAFPHARFIHMQRHPLDTCLSVYFQNFFNVSPFANDLQSLAHYYGQYLRIMAYWRTVLPPGSLLEVPYEGLIADQEGWSRRMLEFLGLEWDPRCLEFHRTERVVITASRWQVRQRAHSGSIGRWRNYAEHLQPLAHLAETVGAP